MRSGILVGRADIDQIQHLAGSLLAMKFLGSDISKRHGKLSSG